MPYGSKAGAVIYAKDLERVSKFYQVILGPKEVQIEADHMIFETPMFQLVILSIPEIISKGIEITDPPIRRTETPIKLVFFVPSINNVRQAVMKLGGELDPPENEWQFQGHSVCDGHDPEGNVIQFREID